LAALRLPPAILATLQQLGIQQIDQLLRLPRSSLSSRWGNDLLLRIHQALGSVPEPIVTHRAEPSWQASWSLEYPTEQRAAVEFVMHQLIHRISQLLADQNRGAVRLEIRLRCVRAPADENTADENPGDEKTAESPAKEVPGTPSLAHQASMSCHAQDTPRVTSENHPGQPVAAAARGQMASRRPSGSGSPRELVFRLDLFRPTAVAEHLVDLAKLQFEHATWPAAVQEVMVEALLTAPLEVRQGELFDGPLRDGQRQLALLVDRLSSRLGRERIVQPRLVADAQPERACRYVPLGGRMPRSRKHASQPDPPHLWQAADRPLHLLHPPLTVPVLATVPDGPPARFCWQRRWHTIVRYWGPERIETGWWRDTTVRRDYYRVETDQGERFWLFRQLSDSRWFLHGRFG
jgi:protein ImuB